MSDFEFEKGRLQDNVVAASQAGLSPIDPGRALLQKLRHSSHIVEDLASLYMTHPTEYAKIMRQLRGQLGVLQVRRLNTLIQEKLEATAQAQADQEKGNTEGGETQTYETSVFDHPVNIAVTEEGEDNGHFDVSTKDIGAIQHVSGHAAFKDGKFREASLQADVRPSDAVSATGGLGLHRDENGKLRPSATLGTSFSLDKLAPNTTLGFSLEITPDGVSRRTDLRVEDTLLTWETPLPEQDEVSDKHDAQTDAPQTDAALEGAERVSEKAADAEKTDQTSTATKGQSAKSNDGAKDVSMPGGGGAPTLSPKGEGTGKNAVEAYANSGLSHQMAHKGNLGEKMSADLQKILAQTNAALPGEKDAVINDGKADAALRATDEAQKSRQQNAGKDNFDTAVKAVSVDTSALDKQKALVSRAQDSLGPRPTIDLDTKPVEALSRQSAEKFAQAQKEAGRMAEQIDDTMATRGFGDLHRPKETLDLDTRIPTEVAAQAADVNALTEEGKALLDSSEAAQKAAADIQRRRAALDQAEAMRDAEIAQATAKEQAGMDAVITQASTEEQAIVSKANTEARAAKASVVDKCQEELSQCHDVQQAEIDAANAEMQDASQKVTAELDDAYAQAEKEEADIRKEAQKKKEDKGILESVGDGLKSAFKAITDWAKQAFASLVNRIKAKACQLMDGLVSLFQRINKDLAQKLSQHVQKLKKVLDRMADALIHAVHAVLDYARELVNKIVDRTVAALQQWWDSLKTWVSDAWDQFREAWAEFAAFMDEILDLLGDIFIPILKTACEQLRVDGAFLDNIIPVARHIVQHPLNFFGTLFKGLLQGFKQFGMNIDENAKACFTNLFNMWLGAANLSLPGKFNLPSLIKLGFDVIGMDVNGILNALGAKNLEDMESLGEIRDISLKKAVEGNPAYQMVQKIKAGGLNAIIDMASDYVSDFVAEIRDYAMETIVKKASAAALAKLAMLATPVSGIIAAIKAVWDLIQFVRENMSAISGLVQAVTSTLAQAATGDGSVVANGVEAALCRLIPLAVDVVLRLAGVNVGGAIQGVVDKIRTRVKGIVDKIIAKLKALIAKTPIGKVLETVSRTKKVMGDVKKGIKGQIDATVDKAGRLVDPHLDKAAHKFNHSSASKKLAAFNDKAQGFADSVNAFTQAASTKTAGMRSTMETATNVLQDFNRADKYGDAFGLDSEAVAKTVGDRLPKTNAKADSETEKQISETEKPNAEAESNSDPQRIERVDLKEDPFVCRYKEEHYKEEFKRQIKIQENGINEMRVGEWLDRVDIYTVDPGESKTSQAQKEIAKKENNSKASTARKDFWDKKWKEFYGDAQRKNETLPPDQRLSETELRKKADIELAKLKNKQATRGDQQVALHTVDTVAGGAPDDVQEMGVSRVNSSIGSQWKVKSKKNGYIPKNQRLKNKVKQQKNSNTPTFKRKRMWVELTMKV